MMSSQKCDAGQVKKPAIFLHIQKTAGTSIVNLIRAHYGIENMISHGDHLDGFSQFPLKDKFFNTQQILSTYDGLPFISGHFGYDFSKPFMKARYSFTFLRNPIERVLSFYYFCKNRDPKQFDIYALTQQMPLDEFLQMGLKDPAVKACIWNNQTWQLAHGYGNSNSRSVSCFEPDKVLELAMRHLDDFSFIGFTERFERDRDEVLANLGIPTPKGNVFFNRNPGRPTSKNLPRSTLKLLEELTHLDQALYEEAWSRRDSFLKNIDKESNQSG